MDFDKINEIRKDLYTRASKIKGIPFKEIDTNQRLKTGKGGIGNLVEEWFGIKPNNRSEPDFVEAKVELKVTPYRRNKNGTVRAKERLVANMIDYMKEVDKTFETSSFYEKCNTILFMFYENRPEVDKSEFFVSDVVLFQFPDEDLEIIKDDWEKIIDKIREGKAHELSERDTLYLAASTKGENRNSLRKQPYSDKLAKQRAYSLKASYMTQLLNNYIFGKKESPKIIKDVSALKDKSLEEYIIEKVTPYFGKTQNELAKLFEIKSSPKNLNEMIIARILGVDGKISKTDEFKKANLLLKTVRVQSNGKVKESMSFPTIDFLKLSEDTWEESDFYNYLNSKRFLFVIFKENEEKEYVFNNIQFWSIPEKDMNEIKRVWERTKEIVNQGVIFEEKNGKTHNNLPKQSESPVCHVRPHGSNKNDTTLLPNGDLITKQCFWFNNDYIKKQIEVKEN